MAGAAGEVSSAAPAVVEEKGAGSKDTIKEQFTGEATRPLAIITAAYLLFTITDGAVRMLVLLHAYNKGFTAMEVAIMFTLYEVAGMVTNLAAGMIGAKWGLRTTLIAGLCLQLCGLGMLFGWQDDWEKGTAIIYVTIASGISGIAKDLTKLGGKTVTKLVTPEEKEGLLFKIVSFVTGMKNSLKGFGYFLGSLLLSVDDDWGYYLALSVLCVLILAALPFAVLGLSPELGRVREKNIKFSDAFTGYPRNLYILSLGRLFLFMSRDMWFEVPLPFYLRNADIADIGGLCNATLIDFNETLNNCSTSTDCVDDTCANIGEGFGGLALHKRTVGIILACYIIFYGQIQSWTPQLVTGPINRHDKENPPNKNTELIWCALLAFPTTFLFIMARWSGTFDAYDQDRTGMIATVVATLVWFAFVFAVNSSIHSFLVVKYAEGNKAAQSVGFYYMSNASGRLIGTVTSGAVYSYASDNKSHAIGYCMLLGTVSCLIAFALTIPLKDDKAPVSCWCVQCFGAGDESSSADPELPQIQSITEPIVPEGGKVMAVEK